MISSKTTLQPRVESLEILDSIQTHDPAIQKLINPRFYLVLISIAFILAINGLDANILGDASPTIAEALGASTRISWVGAVSMIAASITALPIGKIYDEYEPRTILLASLVLYAIGEASAGSARSFAQFVCGRAIAGIALSSTTIAGFLIVALICDSVSQRAIMITNVTALYGIMLKVGPLVSGALLKRSVNHWRWCFYLELPLLGVASLVVLAGFPTFRHLGTVRAGLQGRTILEWIIGSLLQMMMLISLLLPPILGDNTLAWTSGALISLYVIFPVSLAMFCLWTWRSSVRGRLIPVTLLAENPVLPRISIISSCVMTSTFATTFYMPIFFAEVYGSSPIRSAVQTLPLVVFGVVSIAIVGKIIELTGHYVWPCILGSVLQILGGGLFYLLDLRTPIWKVYVLESFLGFAVGSLGAIGNVIAFDNVPKFKFAGIVTWMNLLLFIFAGLGIGLQGAFLGHEIRKAMLDAMTQPAERIGHNVPQAIITSQKHASLMYLAFGCVSLLTSLTLKHQKLR